MKIDFKEYSVVIAGAGLSGAILARKFADDGEKVLVVEKRKHIAGNLFDYKKNGILIQKYGPHVFHTNNSEVEAFVKNYADWRTFVIKCDVFMKNKFTPSPFNFRTIDQFYSNEKSKMLKQELLKEYNGRKSVTILELLDSPNLLIKEYADFLFESDYSLYTAKQWGINPLSVDKNVLKRVPILLNYDHQYFYDSFQAVPEGGFTNFVSNILSHQNIKVILNNDILKFISFRDGLITFNNEPYNGKVVFTGQIDELFDYEYGKLPYRSLKFRNYIIDKKSFQPTPIVAYPEAKKYTRITEYTKLPVQECEKTIVSYEYPISFDSSKNNEPYYPINNSINDNLHKLYLNKAKAIKNLYLCGRLALYKYYNMDQTIECAIDLYEKIKSGDLNV